MATTEEAPKEDAPATEEEYRFEPKIDPVWALNLQQVGAVAAFGVLFMLLNYIPLRATDIWGHVEYGHWILTHGAIPDEDPWMPLATGMQVVDSAWLAQVVFAGVDRAIGPAGLSHLFAIVGLITYLVWARVFYLQTGRVWLSVLATALLIFVGWSRFATIRPENFAALCFALLFLLLARAHVRGEGSDQLGDDEPTSYDSVRFDWALWLGVPLVFALWANLHGSFFCGLAVLGCFFLGRALEVAWSKRSLAAAFADRPTRQWLYLTELAVVATWLNPYGLDLWIHTLQFSANPNLRFVLEWQPLVILGVGGRQFAISVLLLLLVWRHSRRPVRPVEVLLLAVFAAATIGGVRMIGWYAPVFTAVVMPHVADIIGRLLPASERPGVGETDRASAVSAGQDGPQVDDEKEEEEESGSYELAPGHSFRYSLVALLIIWIVFALSPISQPVFRRAPRTPEQLHGSNTPTKLTEFLRANPPSGQVFHPQWWGDWLKRDGPPDLQAFVTSNIHLVPHRVWRDYNRVLSIRSGWERTLDRYRVTTIIVDKEEQENFFSVLNRHSGWQLAYDDDQAAVFVSSTGRQANRLDNQDAPNGDEEEA